MSDDSVLISGERETQESAADLRFWAFASMWAIAQIMHLVNETGGQTVALMQWINLVAAFYVLARPDSLRRFVLLGVAHIAYLLWRAPLAPDHSILTGWVTLAFLLTLLSMRRRGSNLTGGLVLERSLGVIRALLLVGYGAAAIAKYNSTFFDPMLSCAGFLADSATFGVTGNGEVTGWLHIAGAVVPETLIPLLLLVPGTRRYGVRLGVGFHFLLSLSPAIAVRDFTATLLALFPLFLDDSELSELVRRWRNGWTSLTSDRFTQQLVTVPRSVRWIVLTLTVGAGAFVNSGIYHLYLWLAFSFLALSIAYLGLVTLRKSGRTYRRLFAGINAWQVAVVIAMLGYVAMPYYGLRTTGVFTMFSNLVTEGEGTNHFFLPSVHITDIQNDMVVFVDTNVEREDFGDPGQQMPRFEVERELASDPELFVIEATPDSRRILGAGGEPVEEPPWILAKLLHFREVAAEGGVPRCTN